LAIHRFGEFELDNTLYELRRDEQILEIGPRVFDVLAYLIDHRDRLVSKDELIQRVWGATAMSSSSVPTCIAAVRKVLGDDPADPQYIETQRGRGYRFIAELVRHLDAAEAGRLSAIGATALSGDRTANGSATAKAQAIPITCRTVEKTRNLMGTCLL
jgi:DNA-binding winged helix-turn-helix (wHTH) protein